MKVCERLFLLVAVLIGLIALEDASVRALSSKDKRISDQRLAEIQTYLALSRMKGQMMSVPVGYGRVPVEELGRRRRDPDSQDKTLWHLPFKRTVTCDDGGWKLNENGNMPDSVDENYME